MDDFKSMALEQLLKKLNISLSEDVGDTTDSAATHAISFNKIAREIIYKYHNFDESKDADLSYDSVSTLLENRQDNIYIHVILLFSTLYRLDAESLTDTLKLISFHSSNFESNRLNSDSDNDW